MFLSILILFSSYFLIATSSMTMDVIDKLQLSRCFSEVTTLEPINDSHSVANILR